MLGIGVDKLRQILNHGRRGAPREVCGLLSGRDGWVTRVYPLRNLEKDPNRFFASPTGQYRAFQDIEQRGETLVGIYHSHPGGEAVPSPRDVEMAYYPDIAYLILALGREPTVRAFRIREGKVWPGRLVVAMPGGEVRECMEFVFGPEGGPR
ncbi:MAG: M67 family metallopeptidase [Acetobacteraceae bacterium]|nr:M67 family metallopeptidase [Acetobacteraceae bacterium]